MSTVTQAMKAMAPPLLSEKTKLYLWIALAYYLLCRVGESVHEHFLQDSVNSAWITSFLLVANYILFERTLPYIWAKWKRLLLAPFLLAGHLLLYPFGTSLWRCIGIQTGIYTELIHYDPITDGLEYYTGVGIGSALFFGIVQHAYKYIRLQQSAQQLLIEKQAAELKYLKSQTNPHFLFNTLNNIYALAKDNSALAPDSIMRLSAILRFMLYDTGGRHIRIEQEIRVISDYIALERLRYDDTLHIEFIHNIAEPQQAVPPLLLIPLVENAFKHGASETLEAPFVHIRLSLSDQQLSFEVKNSAEAPVAGQEIVPNIGLANLRRQLELLYSDHDLTLRQHESTFTASLRINLASHVKN